MLSEKGSVINKVTYQLELQECEFIAKETGKQLESF